MRKIGFLLLTIGFAWILFIESIIVIRAGLRSAVASDYAQLSRDESKLYTLLEVKHFIVRAAIHGYEAVPQPIIPGVAMFAGGLMLAFGSRGSRPNLGGA